MKKTIFCLMALAAFTFTLGAQNSSEIIAKIEKAYANPKTVETAFSETYTSFDTTVPQKKREGRLSYKAGNIRMDYTNGDLFLIDGNKMTIKNGSANQVFDLTKNIMMKGLSNTLNYAFQGQLTKLATEQNADITATREGDYYLITCTARKKAPRGYSKIVAYYRVSNCLITSMRMDEFNGATTFYTIAK